MPLLFCYYYLCITVVVNYLYSGTMHIWCSELSDLGWSMLETLLLLYLEFLFELSISWEKQKVQSVME
jgi:hypothetical protein